MTSPHLSLMLMSCTCAFPTVGGPAAELICVREDGHSLPLIRGYTPKTSPLPPWAGGRFSANLAMDKSGAMASTLKLLGLALPMLSQPYPLLSRTEMLWTIVSPFFLSRIALGSLTHSAEFQPGGPFMLHFHGAALFIQFCYNRQKPHKNV